MPPGHEPFLAAVCAAPWDDLPRLVFADWLEEQGDADRAEFIRLQCATVGVRKRDPRCRRAAQLLREHGGRWRAELPTLERVSWWEFRRGFVAEAVVFDTTPVGVWLPRLVAATPVQSLTVAADGDVPQALAASPHLAGLSRLEATDWYGWDDMAVERLAANPAAGRLRTLVLSGRQRYGRWLSRVRRVLTDRAAYALAGSRTLRRLGTVRLDGADLSADALDALRRRFGSGLTVIG